MMINLIGLGGTGGYLLPNILRLLKEKGIQVELHLYDPDHVETKNVPRQNFCYADLGKNKALVLAERYSEAFGIPIIACDKKYDHDNALNADLYISAVDNNETRRLVMSTARNHTVLDIGNELHYGQVFYHNVYPYDKNTPRSNIYEIHPEIEENKKQSCADTTGQSFLVNYMAANVATMFLNHLIITRYRPKYFEMLFDVSGIITKRYCKDYDIFKKLAEKQNKGVKVEDEK